MCVKNCSNPDFGYFIVCKEHFEIFKRCYLEDEERNMYEDDTQRKGHWKEFLKDFPWC